MTNISRRNWIRKGLLASSMPLVGGVIPWSSLDPFNTYLQSSSSQNVLRLNWNENPYGPPASAIKVMRNVLTITNHYPDDLIEDLKKSIALRHGLTHQHVLLTAGSTEVLSLLGQHVGLQKGEILTPWPSFPTLIRFGERTGASIKKVPLRKDTIDLDALFDGITAMTKLIFICNPNNPTSTELDHSDLEAFCKNVPAGVLICVDEAYIEYSKHGPQSSMVKLIQELDNLLVCRTFSKAYGLAGLRIGYAISNPSNIDALRSRHTGWELSAGSVPVSAAKVVLDDNDFVKYVINQNLEGRSIVYRALDSWDVRYSYSSTNFLYIESARFEADVVQQLSKQNILITKWPDMHDHIRISIGRPEEMKVFVDSIGKYVM